MRTYSALDSDNAEIVRFAKALRESEISTGYENYYLEDGEGAKPFFKIAKPYEKEKEGDPDFHYIFVDIYERGDCVEYKVTMVYSSLYVSELEDCIALCCGLYAERLCELALVTPIGLASGFAIHTGSHEQNVKLIIDNAESIIDNLQSLAKDCVLSKGTVQMRFGNGLFLNSICFRNADRFQYDGITVYAASYLCAYHPEIYVLQ